MKTDGTLRPRANAALRPGLRPGASAAPPPGRRRGATAALAAAAALSFLFQPMPREAAAQSAEEIEAGRYEIRLEDRRVGTENFAVRREGGVVRAAGRIALEAEAPGLSSMDVRLQTNQNFRPSSYALRATAGPLQGVDGVWSGDRLRLHISSDQGERWKEFLTPGPVAILEHGVAHHYYLMFRQLSPDPAGARIAVIVPSRNRQATATVRGGERESIRIGEEQRQAVRWEVQVDGDRHMVWLDDNGRVLRLSTPAENRVSNRMP